VVGVTNVSPQVSPPILWKYAVCGQYPGKVPQGATVTLRCRDNLPPYRYVVVHFPSTAAFNVCEIQVRVRSMPDTYRAEQCRPCDGSKSIGSICCGLAMIIHAE